MAEANDGYTPEQLALVKRLAEDIVAKARKAIEAMDKAGVLRAGWQVQRVIQILLDIWPPNGQPPANRSAPKQIVDDVNAAYIPIYGDKVSRNTIMKAVKLLANRR